MPFGLLLLFLVAAAVTVAVAAAFGGVLSSPGGAALGTLVLATPWPWVMFHVQLKHRIIREKLKRMGFVHYAKVMIVMLHCL